MSLRAALIAGREFRTYVFTVSFWLSVALGPLLAIGASFLIPSPPSSGGPAGLVLSRSPEGRQEVRFGVDVSEAARREILRSLAHGSAAPVGQPPPAQSDAAPIVPRLLLVVAVWAVVTGSTGMGLHAVARERAARTLEGLLALAKPWEIVAGKLLGVALVGLLVLSMWLIGGAATGAGSLLGSPAPSHLPTAAEGVRMVLLVASAVAFYGLLAIGIGGRARDISDAQNLARPLFALLLIAFFASLISALGDAGTLPWLGYAPPFSPFLLLLHPRPPAEEGVIAVLLVAGCGWAAAFAASSLRMGPTGRRRLLHAVASRLRRPA